MQTHSLRPAQPTDYTSVVTLLQQVHLPTDDLPIDLTGFVLVFEGSQLLGSVGLTPLGAYGLLRSLAVGPTHQNRGLGRQLVEIALDDARQQGLEEVYLITTTADRYFEGYGFAQVSRDGVPEPIAQTRQFSAICPSSAVVMKKTLA